jgi:hypothetical protein
MKVNYTLTMADYKASQRLHRRLKLSRRFIPFIYPSLTAFTSIGIFICLITDTPKMLMIWMPLLAGGLTGTILTPIIRFYAIRNGFKRIFLSGRVDQNISIDINDEYIFSELPGIGEGKYFWNGIVDFAQDEKITLLYVYKDRFLLFPTAVLSPDQRTELNDLVARNMVRKEK